MTHYYAGRQMAIDQSRHRLRVITPRSTFGLYEKDNARNRTTLTKFTYGLNVGHHNIFKVSISAAQNFGDAKIL